MPPPPNVSVPSMQLRIHTNAEQARVSPDAASHKPVPPAATALPKRPRQEAHDPAAAAPPPLHDVLVDWEDKKQSKRAANRLSAHLSRKRKKVFIDDLKDENVELRRKELILRSIPDLIVVFDSGGCISFVSHSVTRFLGHTAEELEYTSFWELLTEESVRLIKSAFMDALSVKRPPGEDATPLCGGDTMTIKLVHSKGRDDAGQAEEGMFVSLKGVVHFTRESAECVCSIRPDSNGRGVSMNTEELKPVVQEPQQRKTASGRSHQISDIDSEKS